MPLPCWRLSVTGSGSLGWVPLICWGRDGPASRFQPGREVPDDHSRLIRCSRHDLVRLHRSRTVVLAGFVAGHRGLTREAWALDLRQFASWCRARLPALFAVRRPASGPSTAVGGLCRRREPTAGGSFCCPGGTGVPVGLGAVAAAHTGSGAAGALGGMLTADRVRAPGSRVAVRRSGSGVPCAAPGVRRA